MYAAKRTRTGHEVYLPERDHHSPRRLELLGELRDGLEAGQLVLHYQPKAEIATGEVRGVEALVRWAHPRRGLLPPADFLPLAEHTGLGRALTAFVVDRALEEIGALRNGHDLSVAVNLGPADLLDLGLPSEIDRLLRRRRFQPEHLHLEVSEDVIMADPERTLEVLAGLRAIGVGTALDDFGAGHASLGHLKALNVDELKIDRSFVIGLPGDERDMAIVYATVELARRLGHARRGRGRGELGELGRPGPAAVRRGAGVLPLAPVDRLRAGRAGCATAPRLCEQRRQPARLDELRHLLVRGARS